MWGKAQTRLPAITHVLELCLYARHLPTSVQFYRDTLQLGQPHLDTPRMAGFSLGNTQLLIFQQGQTTTDLHMSKSDPSLVIPKHGLQQSEPSDQTSSSTVPKLHTHFCLAVDKPSDVDEWERELRDKNVTILGRANWPPGGKSVYFSDPDEHVGEIASKGIWPNY
ncbi:hypothetical protein ACM66B_001112 [Microbotryomycetes sp. NB124-2]